VHRRARLFVGLFTVGRSAVPVTGPLFGLLALAAAAVVARDRRR